MNAFLPFFLFVSLSFLSLSPRDLEFADKCAAARGWNKCSTDHSAFVCPAAGLETLHELPVPSSVRGADSWAGSRSITNQQDEYHTCHGVDSSGCALVISAESGKSGCRRASVACVTEQFLTEKQLRPPFAVLAAFKFVTNSFTPAVRVMTGRPHSSAGRKERRDGGAATHHPMGGNAPTSRRSTIRCPQHRCSSSFITLCVAFFPACR